MLYFAATVSVKVVIFF